MDLNGALGEKPVMVTAHPDDESLWAGGLPCHFPDKQWEIICCSIPVADPERAWKFFDACTILGAIPRLIPFQEGGASSPLAHLSMLDLSSFTSVVTHNQWGEYGHLHHKQVNNYVRNLLREAKKPMITFGYRPDGHGSEEVILNDQEYVQKMFALRCYDHKLLYEGELMTKADALIKRYTKDGNLDLKKETYDIHAA